MFIHYLLLIISISALDYQNYSTKITIYEELPSNTLIYPSISSSKILQWLPSSYIFQSYFILTTNQSLYTSEKLIDREIFCKKKYCNCSQCIINLNFLQIFSTNNISIRTIEIIIEDINDHSPIFKRSIIKLSIAENVPVNYQIPLESAIDQDYGILSIQTYSLFPSLNNPFHLLTRLKPILQLKDNLDREIQSKYVLKLLAYDGGQPSLYGEQIIEIIITDVNDNPPIFEQMIYRKTFPENQPIDSILIKIQAYDRDEGENARINYSLDDHFSIFDMNSQTGEIFLKKSFDYEKIRSYTLTIKAHDYGVSQLNNYATLIIDVTDVNDHTPTVLFTQVNGTIMNNRLINLPECSMKNTPLFYIYITDQDSNDNARVSCTLNDTRLNLIDLTINAYSLQINDNLPTFDYEIEQSVVINLQCTDAGQLPLSTSILFHFQIEDCNDHPPDILSPLPFNQSIVLISETIELPLILSQLIVNDRDQYQEKLFFYSYTVSPNLNLSLSSNGTLILHSIPFHSHGYFLINITVSDLTNLTSTISIPLEIYSINQTNYFSLKKNINLMTFLIVFIIIFLAAIFIGLCFLLAFLLRTKFFKKTSLNNSSSQSITSSNEQTADSSQKTTIEVFDERMNSSNHIYQQQYGIEQARNVTCTMDQSDFHYTEKVQRYLTDLSCENDSRGIIDGYSDSICSQQSLQQISHESFKRFEQLYALIEREQQSYLDISTFTSDSLYV